LPRVGIERHITQSEPHSPPEKNPEKPHNFLKVSAARGCILAPYFSPGGRSPRGVRVR
jgi:hypothetical protein